MTMAMLKQAFAGSHQVLNENPYYSHKCPDFDQGGILEAEIEWSAEYKWSINGINPFL